jgi:hypothetical protein
VISHHYPPRLQPNLFFLYLKLACGSVFTAYSAINFVV